MFLLRHGQSYFNLLFNETRVDPGIEDPELTPLGLQQAAAAATRLADTVLTHVIISPYTRALQTAQPILGIHKVPVTIMHEVREQAAFACDVGSAPDLLSARFPHHDFAHLPPKWWNEPGETHGSRRARARMPSGISWPPATTRDDAAGQPLGLHSGADGNFAGQRRASGIRPLTLAGPRSRAISFVWR